MPRRQETPAGEPEDVRGTVRGLALSGAAAACCTRIQTGCNPDITTVFTGTCNNC